MNHHVTSAGNALEYHLDVLEALKRALIRRGHIPQPIQAQPTHNEALQPRQLIGVPTVDLAPAAIKITETTPKTQTAGRKDSKKLAVAANKSHEILFKADTVWPFTLFPDTVTIDREKLSFATRYFFRVARITNVPIRDILSVEANIGLFFGSVKTSSRYFITNPYKISFLSRSNAIQLQRLL